ncbi:acyl-CoA dehydrogenase C-terminal domain-containing protein, partial [Shewanella sp. 0m-11]
NGIQAIDFLGRKVTGDNVAALSEFVAEQIAKINGYAHVADGDKATLLALLEQLLEVANQVNDNKLSQPALINSCAVDYLDAFGYVLYGCFWLAMNDAAHDHEDENFKLQKAHLGRFYFDKLLAKAQYHLSQVKTGDASIMQIDESLF